MRWGIIGVGYIAPRHLAAIRATGGEIVTACDARDSVGVLDAHALGCQFTMDADAFWASCEGLDGVAVCTPNHLHVAHATEALRRVPIVMLEKPASTTLGGLDEIAEAERRYGGRCNVVLNLRHHPAVVAARDAYAGTECRGNLTYRTPRGPWYWQSWKGDPGRSGGLALNIGVHLFDALCWMFGPECAVDASGAGDTLRGEVAFERASVHFELSTRTGAKAERSLILNGETVDFTSGFSDLHTTVYSEALAGRGHGVDDCRPGLALALRVARG